MRKLLKTLRPYILPILAVIALLYGQAMCDLALPDYMSNIVNKGIQQGGVVDGVPQAIRQSRLDQLLLLLSDQDASTVRGAYRLIRKDDQSAPDYKDNLAQYPVLAQENIYLLNKTDDATEDILTDILPRTMMVASAIDGGQLPNIPPGMDPWQLIAMMDSAKRTQMLAMIDDQMKGVAPSMIEQASALLVKSEYQQLQMDMGRLQTVYILKIGGMMLLISLLSMTAAVIAGLLSARIAAGWSRDLRAAVFERVESFSSWEFDNFSTASLITRTTNDVQQVQMLVIMVLRIVVYAPIMGVGGVFRILNTDTSMAWIIALAVGVIMVMVAALFLTVMPKFKMMQKLVDRLNLVMREALSGMLVIRAFNAQRHEEKRFETANNNLTDTALFVNRVMALMFPLMMLIMNGLSILIVWVGGQRVDIGEMQVGSVMAYIQYSMQIVMSFLMISMVSIILPRALVSVQRIREVVNVQPHIVDPETPKPFDDSKKGWVEFRNVSFAYPGAEQNVVRDVSFVAKPGETTAIIGSTGCGKSTLIDLIPRFYDVSEGQVLVSGRDVREVTQSDLRAKIGYISQKAILFSGSIRSNLSYGKEDATQEELDDAASTAQALEFIQEREEGFEDHIAQGGGNVSGGQKQRLSIARAIVKDPDIYIFDDSFSALDYKTDARLRAMLNEKTGDSTVIIVAQRINTIMHAQQIIVLEDGAVVGSGTHEELLRDCEVYKEIALSQFSKEELAV